MTVPPEKITSAAPVPAKSSKKDGPPPPKKRKRATTKKTKTSTAASSERAKVPPPTKVLVVDNGGDTLKYGWNTDDSPEHLPNVTARLQQQWTVLAGDQLSSIHNPNSLLGVTRSTERGMIVNLGNQVQVWKRMLDLLNVSIPTGTDAAHAFGWKSVRPSASQQQHEAAPKIQSHTCAVLLGLPPHCPRSILDQILMVWLEDFGFGHVGFCVSSAVALEPHPDLKTCCVVDVGWSATHIVPTYQEKIVDAQAIRRMPLAGRHLINIWKYYVSYRQYNLMDQEWILRDVLHQTGYISMQFDDDMQTARAIPAGRRPYDREYVLPDYQNTFQGRVQLPVALQKEADDADEEEIDEDVDEKEMEETEEDDDNLEQGSESDEEETPEQIRRRLLKQRQEEERRRLELEAEQQVLNVTVERFAVPEALFRPTDVGLPSDWASLPAAIVQSIGACPKPFQPALYRSIHLVGGLSQLPNLRDRLERELRALAPCEYEIEITASESPVDKAWQGARTLSKGEYTTWSVSRDDWESASKRGAWRRLMLSEGGHLI